MGAKKTMRNLLLALVLVLAFFLSFISCTSDEDLAKNDTITTAEDGVITITTNTSMRFLGSSEKYRLVITDYESQVWRAVKVMRLDREELLIELRTLTDGRSSVIIYPELHWTDTQRPYCTIVRSFEADGKSGDAAYFRPAFDENGYRYNCVESITGKTTVYSATTHARTDILRILHSHDISPRPKNGREMKRGF